MDAIESALPSKCLAPYVRAYAQRNLLSAREPLVEPVPARLEQVLEFELGDPFEISFNGGNTILSPQISIVGWQTHLRADLRMTRPVQSLGIFFQPAGFSRLFRMPLSELRDTYYEGTSVLGRRIRSLWNQLGEASSFPARVVIIERFLLQQSLAASAVDVADACADRILQRHGLLNMEALTREFQISQRQLERRFETRIGISPKSFSRIARFQTALDLKVVNPQRTWLSIAHSLGYFDQMHLIHDFRNLCGETPGRLFAHLGDARPEAVASAGATET
jgi:AraC-like DNA-binding protein